MSKKEFELFIYLKIRAIHFSFNRSCLYLPIRNQYLKLTLLLLFNGLSVWGGLRCWHRGNRGLLLSKDGWLPVPQTCRQSCLQPACLLCCAVHPQLPHMLEGSPLHWRRFRCKLGVAAVIFYYTRVFIRLILVSCDPPPAVSSRI